MGSKVCSKCKIEKDLSEFYIRKTGRDAGRVISRCISCLKADDVLNAEKNSISQKKWNLAHPNHVKMWVEQNKEKNKLTKKAWNEANQEKIKLYRKKAKIKQRVKDKEKFKTDPLYRCQIVIRKLIAASIKGYGYTKKARTFKILGCSYKEFNTHIENQFKPGMTWLNHGEWHLDHKVPMALAKTEEEIIKLNHYTNFQPLWAKDNLTKGNKIDPSLVENSTTAIKEIALTTITTQEK